jgi:adenine-specific DNA-methyltransferase
LRLPRVLDGPCAALGLDALEAAAAVEADVAYLDPPYNQHSYLGNYHVWESLVRWDKPEVYGVACKRVDTRARASRFNSRRRAAEAFAEVVSVVRAPRLLVSFSDEGFLARDWLEGLLAERGHVVVAPIDYKRYVGAQIGIHDRQGRRVGRVSHLRNTEYLYAVTPVRLEAEALSETVATATG